MHPGIGNLCFQCLYGGIECCTVLLLVIGHMHLSLCQWIGARTPEILDFMSLSRIPGSFGFF